MILLYTSFLLLSLSHPGIINSQNFQFHYIHYETDNITATVGLQLEATYGSTTGDVCANGINNSLANLMCQEFYHEVSPYASIFRKLIITYSPYTTICSCSTSNRNCNHRLCYSNDEFYCFW